MVARSSALPSTQPSAEEPATARAHLQPVSGETPPPVPGQALATPPAQPATGDDEEPQTPSTPLALTGLFVIALVGVLQYAQELLMPIAVAGVLALVFSPVVRFLGKLKVPSVLAAILILLGLIGLIGVGTYSLSGPVERWVERAPSLEGEVREKLSALREPLAAVQEAEKRISEVTNGDDGSDTATVGEADEPQRVVVEGPGFLQSFAFSAFSAFSSLVVTLILLTFLLASGDLFYAKLVEGFDRMRDKKKALRTAHDIERTVSRYLFTITIINVCLGIAVSAAMWALDMPTPWLWGTFATLANFVPYIGAIAGLALVSTVALVSFDTLGQVVAVAAAYFACTTFEGQVVTPVIVGRRLELNTVAVFVAVAFWAWVWGIVGAIIAVPMLVIFKTVADQSSRWQRVSNFLADD